MMIKVQKIIDLGYSKLKMMEVLFASLYPAKISSPRNTYPWNGYTNENKNYNTGFLLTGASKMYGDQPYELLKEEENFRDKDLYEFEEDSNSD